EETKNSNWYWDLSPEKIELFRSFDGQWGIIANHPLMQTSNEDNNMGKTYKEYLDGAISKEELVRRLDQKVQMVEMEAE
ncbi:MAG: hypothetical protein GX786_03715, partial [Clostridiales bacterium]|nr:hypothetical protein [Clostridiales bacterium]